MTERHDVAALNGFVREIEAAATETGWMLIEYVGRSPGYVSLVDARGTEVTIRTDHGIGLVEQIRKCQPMHPYSGVPHFSDGTVRA